MYNITLFLALFQRPLDGYAFPVFTTEFCPRDIKEFGERSKFLSCTQERAYRCIFSENKTKFVELCYRPSRRHIEIGKKKLNTKNIF